MNLDELRAERSKAMRWKNIAPIKEALDLLEVGECSYELGDAIRVQTEGEFSYIAKMMMPWRKGPFQVGDLFIDSEWQSFMKYDLIKEHFDLQGKVVADVGCNNGYYMFRMLEHSPAKLVGFDPSPLYKLQFEFIDKFIKSGIVYEPLGVEHLEFYEHKFDVIFALGILYHRSDPIVMLKSLARSLSSGGEVVLDTFYIEGESEVALCPKNTYSKIPNVHFVPTINALKNWCTKVGFESFELLCVSKTSIDEQRKTEWIEGESLSEFLDPNDDSKTVEGYDAPRRVYVKLKKER